MKTKVMKSISKKLLSGILAVAMVISGVVIIPNTAKAATEVYFATMDEYKMSDYWSTSQKKVPVKEGYVFSGWYKNDKTTPLKQADLEVADDTAVAKFVPTEVLSIKTQKGTSQDGKISLRLLSSVDSTNYQEVGFKHKLAITNEGTTSDTKVYSKIRQSKDSDITYEPGATFVSGVSKYFFAADVTNIKEASFGKIIYARPYWVTMDGTTVLGAARNNRVEDKQQNYSTASINLFTDGKVPAMVAAGKIQVKYNTTDYNVVSVDTTVHNTDGGKYLFPEMEYHVDEDMGIITFVGTIATVDANLLADGLFANVRFEKVSEATNPSLDFAINADVTDFCDLDEEGVTGFVIH